VRPVVLTDWPAPLCALARPKPGAPEVVERFEAYVAGLELCNGFGELCDEVEQRRRLVHDASERARRGLPVYPQDERFLGALAEGMPPAGGVALGVDRLMMLLLDAADIRQVLAFSADEL
jgi:lysyl-tRNA synthetase class 2